MWLIDWPAIYSYHFGMPQCTGCSRPYRHLVGDRCEPCTESGSVSKPRNEWPVCTHCSRRFEFLEKDRPCIACKEHDSQDSIAMPPPALPHGVLAPVSSQTQHEDIQYAMTHPVNARTHSARDTPSYRNPMQSYNHDGDENDVSLHFLLVKLFIKSDLVVLLAPLCTCAGDIQ